MVTQYLVVCSIPEGALSRQQKQRLEDGLTKVYQSNIGTNVKAKFLWMNIPKGQAYLAAAVEGTITVLATMPDGLATQPRRSVLYGIQRLWKTETGCQDHQLIISAADKHVADQFLMASRQRPAALFRIPVMLKLIARLLVSKMRSGHLETSVNL